MRYFTFYFYNFVRLCCSSKHAMESPIRKLFNFQNKSGEKLLIQFMGALHIGHWRQGTTGAVRSGLRGLVCCQVVLPMTRLHAIQSIMCWTGIPVGNDDDWRTRFKWTENIELPDFSEWWKMVIFKARRRCAPTRSKRQSISIWEAFQNEKQFQWHFNGSHLSTLNEFWAGIQWKAFCRTVVGVMLLWEAVRAAMSINNPTIKWNATRGTTRRMKALNPILIYLIGWRSDIT